MLHSTPEWEAFEREEIRQQPPNFNDASQVFEELYILACDLGKLPPANPLEGFEYDIILRKRLDALQRKAAAPSR